MIVRYSNKRFLFIPLIIFFLSCTKLFAQNTDRLIGKWELLSIETDTAKIEFPKSEKFKLIISKDSLQYNLFAILILNTGDGIIPILVIPSNCLSFFVSSINQDRLLNYQMFKESSKLDYWRSILIETDE